MLGGRRKQPVSSPLYEPYRGGVDGEHTIPLTLNAREDGSNHASPCSRSAPTSTPLIWNRYDTRA